ncbi:protein translocase subunit SecD [Soehngenia longivitae]|uniref:Protein translocase subunit SecD n=1 Tax=Soehngenia longivitae TaxID=2562294 RepID=A0A4Z0D2I3_9FIRM|nr:protein translocase subunit SecD [Soehngenia longivitae]TFZ39538.1 protein translocase subunit SecD [Soehngenia longivitae]
MKKSLIILIFIVLFIILLSFIAVFGVELGNFSINNVKDSLDLGLDLNGGIYVVLEAKTDKKGEELNKLMEQTKSIIMQRVDGLGVSEPNIVIEGNNRIRIELAGIKDPQQAIDLIGKTAQLEFLNPNKMVVLTGKNIVDAKVVYKKDQLEGDKPVVSIEMDKEGAEIFYELTKQLSALSTQIDKTVYIVLDGNVISAPTVAEPIENGKPIIDGDFTFEEANNLATLIRAGALPVPMEELQTSIIGPSLGLEAFDKSIFAAGIAMLIIFLFMVIIYRLPGIVASLGLVLYTLIVLYFMVFIHAKLTLPGIAGLVLSIGMAVDANVIIFERIKEEIKSGKTIRVAVNLGFNRALRSILDSNMTTLIAGIILYVFGIGPIKGFGVTLTIGIIASMLTAVIFTKYVLKLIVDITGNNNSWLYGVKEV